jgi:hypothetical protein
MTTTITPPPEASSDTTDRPRLQLSATQVTASALAATTATVAASYLGVAGTVIGAAVASVLTVTGNAVYSHSIQRTSDRVRTVVPAAARFTPRGHAPAPTAPERTARRGRRPAWTVLAAACVGVFAGVLIVVTGIELAAGRPLSDVVQGKPGSGTSVLGNTGGTQKPAPVPKVTVTVTPTVVTSTPTVTKTATPTAPTTPTATTTPTPTATPTASPSSSPSGSSSATATAG